MKKITKKGLLIVIDGTDGSGKATQTKLLADMISAKGRKPYTIAFPRYNELSGQVVNQYLKGEFGVDPKDISPYQASLFYASDRVIASHEIKQKLEEGCVVIGDRYVSSNMAHQGCKCKDEIELRSFLDWLCDLEYVKCQLPVPDLSLILHVTPEVSAGLIEKRGAPKDIHEKDSSHLRRASDVYMRLPELLPEYDFAIIECMDESEKILPEPIIAERIFKAIEHLL